MKRDHLWVTVSWRVFFLKAAALLRDQDRPRPKRRHLIFRIVVRVGSLLSNCAVLLVPPETDGLGFLGVALATNVY